MKTKFLIFTAVFLAVCFAAGNLSAQDNFEKVMEKYLNNDTFISSKVIHRDPSTSKTTYQMVNFNIKDNKSMLDEFLAAFRADEGKATRVIENTNPTSVIGSVSVEALTNSARRPVRTKTARFEYNNSGDRTDATITINIHDDANATVIYMTNYGTRR